MNAERRLPPLVVDLDRSLLATDLLHESVVALLRSNVIYLLLNPPSFQTDQPASKRHE